MTIAQDVYDLRTETGFCSGKEMQHFFEGELGEPAPSGEIAVDTDAAKLFVENAVEQAVSNSPSTAGEMELALQIVDETW